MTMIVAAGLCGCAAQTSASNDHTVNVSFAYGANEKTERQWRAWLTALDECHGDGYQDAYPAGDPAISCDQASSGVCTRFLAHAAYDCVGLAYQTN
jgi:hypothetical protein